jgi:hypothetical protein
VGGQRFDRVHRGERNAGFVEGGDDGVRSVEVEETVKTSVEDLRNGAYVAAFSSVFETPGREVSLDKSVQFIRIQVDHIGMGLGHRHRLQTTKTGDQACPRTHLGGIHKRKQGELEIPRSIIVHPSTAMRPWWWMMPGDAAWTKRQQRAPSRVRKA